MKQSKPWHREGRGWYLTVNGKQTFLSKDRDEAFSRYHEFMASNRKTPAVGSPTVLEVCDRFVEWVRDNRAPVTANVYKERLALFLATIPASFRISQLTPQHIEAWLAVNKTQSPTTRRNKISAVQAALRWALGQGIISHSPIAHVRKPSAGHRDNVLTPDQFHAALGRAKYPALRDVLVATWETGARPQEVLRVEAKDVDVTGKRWIFPPARSKGRKVSRVVYLTDAALEITKRRMKLHPRGPIFRNRSGRAWTPSAVDCGLKRLASRIGYKFALVDLRHSFATRMLLKGVDPITIATLMGHRDPTMLAKVYQHIVHDSGHLLSAIAKADGATS